MNTVERVVEAYFRVCRGCFTMADVKVAGGNNRQLDLLALNPLTRDQYHIETSVTHQENWCPSSEKLLCAFERKFFGVPKEKSTGKPQNTDFGKGKTYRQQIFDTYKAVGLDPETIRRVWVCWIVTDSKNIESSISDYCKRRELPERAIEVISFRDLLLPELLANVQTSNYDDDILRLLSLIRQSEKQSRRKKGSP